jgi:hypothetical protein
MSIALGWARPGWGWVPPLLFTRRYWRVVGRFALWGPLIGGLPYAWLIITVPFAFALGLIPATLAGMLFAAWLLAPGRYPSAGWRAALGMLCAAVSCAAVALAVTPRTPLGIWVPLALHGVPAGLVLALTQRAPRSANDDSSRQ